MYHTPDEPEPPRRHYDLKPKEGFERANTSKPAEKDAPTDVREMFKLAGGPLPIPKRRSTDRNDVHEILDFNILKEKEAGLFNVTPGVDTRSIRRRKTFYVPFLIVNIFAAAILAACIKTGEWGAPQFFMIAGCGSADAVILFHAFFFRTE